MTKTKKKQNRDVYISWNNKSNIMIAKSKSFQKKVFNTFKNKLEFITFHNIKTRVLTAEIYVDGHMYIVTSGHDSFVKKNNNKSINYDDIIMVTNNKGEHKFMGKNKINLKKFSLLWYNKSKVIELL